MNVFNLSANPLCVNLASSCQLFSFQITYFSDNSVNFHSVKFNVFLQYPTNRLYSRYIEFVCRKRFGLKPLQRL